jgi:type III pantothenate kinase
VLGWSNGITSFLASRMLLAVDIGNTNIVLGVFDQADELKATWRISTDLHRMPDEYSVMLSSLLGLAEIRPEDLHGAVICSVVPSVQTMLCESLAQAWKLEPLILSPETDLGIAVRYSPPSSVGADRIANAVAAIKFYGCPAIVVDFGTATTFDAISQDGAYVGGAIAPGLEVSEEALASHTAKLPRVPLIPPEFAVGRNTIESLQAGLLYGYGGLVDGLVERLKRELGEDTRVIATGGLAATVQPCTRSITTIDLDLTLQGLRLLFDRNRGDARYSGVRENQPVA